MTFESKKREELFETCFFLERFNARHGTDYQAFSNDSENTQNEWVDVFAVSSSQKYPTLNLQLKTRDAILKETQGKLKAEARRTKRGFARGFPISIDIVQWTQKASRKKRYDPAIMQSLVLLIVTDIGPLLNEVYAKESFAGLQFDNYKGIYYVHLPNEPENSSHPHNGQIVSIKGINKENGSSF